VRVQARSLSLALAASALLSACDESPPDHYVLALSWQPTFCEFNGDKPECGELDGTDFAATHLAIHGLWPDSPQSTRLRYCGVEEEVERIDEQSRWCELPEPEITDKTRAELERAMPGVRSCLDRHEWIEHGTCARVSAEEYFAITLRLASDVRASRLGQLLAANVNRTLPRRKLIQAFEAEYGPGAGRALTLLCKPLGEENLLIEIRITLEPSAMDGRLDGRDLRLGTPRGSCPTTILIDPVGP
jgi:ribonuclease T2